MKNAVLYCRVANNSDNGLLKQKNDMLSFAKESGYNIKRIYEEVGSGLDFERSELSKILNDAEKKFFDVLFIKEFNRIGRTEKALSYIDRIESYGVEIKYLYPHQAHQNENIKKIINEFFARV